MNESEGSMNIMNFSPESQLSTYTQGIEKITTELMNFGLTKTQSKVFIYLGKYGSKTSPQVCKDLKLPRTETYHILNKLTNLGIVVSEFSHPAKYSAISMEKAISTLIMSEEVRINMLSERKKLLAKLWKDIPCFFSKSAESENEKFQMLQGSPRIHNKMKHMISNTQNGCKLVCSAKDLSRFYYSKLIEIDKSLTHDMKIIISPDNLIPEFIRKIGYEIGICSKNLLKNQCFLIKDNDELLIFLKNANYPPKSIFAFWTDSSSLIDSMNLLFDFTWKNSNPIRHQKLIIS